MSRQTSVQWRLTGFAALATVLTSLALLPTVADGGWGDRILVSVAVIAVCGGLVRELGLPRPLVPLVQVAALSIYLAISFGDGQAVAGILPGPEVGRHFLELVNDGFTVTWNEAPPVSATEGVAFLLVSGVALIALLVDAVAVTWRHPTLAGLPLFVLYLVPAAVLPEGVPWPLFVLAGLGWVLLQLAEGRDRLTRWGRLLGTRAEATSGIHAVGGTGRRLGATALAVAVIIPVVLPSLDDGVFGGGGGSADGEGGSGGNSPGFKRISTINPIVSIRRDLRRGEDIPILRYQSSDLAPEYLRIATLDRFNGSEWQLEETEAADDQQVTEGLPTPPGLAEEVPRTTVTTQVNVLALNSLRLPLPYPVTKVAIDGDWRWDADTFDVFTAESDGNAQGTEYTATSLNISPTATVLRDADQPRESLETYLALPSDTQDLLTPITADVVAGEPTSYDKALAIQNWFREDFEYSLDTAAGNGTDALQSFLLDDRSGYCEQFSTSMALMARAVGIPSRVQVGFTPGERLDDGTWEVTTHDAHAWPELWFEGVGWVRFEPTPGGGDGGATPGYAPPPASSIGGGGTNPNGDPRGNANNPPLRRTGPDAPQNVPDDKQLPKAAGGSRGADPLAAGELPVTEQAGRWTPYLLLLILLALVVGLTPAVAKRVERRRRWAGVEDEPAAIHAAWADVLSAATDVDLAPKPTETTRDLAIRLRKQGGLSKATAARLSDLAQALEQARYANRTSPDRVAENPQEVSARTDAWRTVANDVGDGFLAAVSPRDRRRARWWPASGRSSVAARWGAATTWLDTRWAAVTSRVASPFRRA